jgi:hypothetical protein
VNHPSVKLSNLTTDGGIRTTRNLAEKGKKRSVGRVEKGSASQGSQKRTAKPWNHRDF